VARREVEGPKKITDVHEDAKREVSTVHSAKANPDNDQNRIFNMSGERHPSDILLHQELLCYNCLPAAHPCPLLLSPLRHWHHADVLANRPACCATAGTLPCLARWLFCFGLCRHVRNYPCCSARRRRAWAAARCGAARPRAAATAAGATATTAWLPGARWACAQSSCD